MYICRVTPPNLFHSPEYRLPLAVERWRVHHKKHRILHVMTGRRRQAGRRSKRRTTLASRREHVSSANFQDSVGRCQRCDPSTMLLLLDPDTELVLQRAKQRELARVWQFWNWERKSGVRSTFHRDSSLITPIMTNTLQRANTQAISRKRLQSCMFLVI
jgi:hypothetical protein